MLFVRWIVEKCKSPFLCIDLLECPPAVGDTTISSHKIKPTDSLSSSDTEINRKRSSSSLSSDEGDHNTSNDGVSPAR